MKTSSRLAFTCSVALLITGASAWPRFAAAQTGVSVTVERLAVVGSEQGLGVQVIASAPVTTEAQMLTGPDRLVIDFPGALPGRALRGLRLNQGQIKAVRAGLFRSNPPITRIVIDLNEPTAYRLVTAGTAVFVKLGSEPAMAASQAVPGVSIDRHPTARALAALPRPATPPLRVGFERGLLTISASKATLADVLYQVHLRTGADIPIPSGAEQEQVAIQAGPGAPKDVLAALLNGSRFNYVLQGTAQDPQGVGAVILTPKSNLGPDSYTPPPQPTEAPEQQLAAPELPPNPPMQPNGGSPIPVQLDQVDPE